MADYGIKVSRPGFDIKQAADNQLLYSSAFATFPVILSGTLATGSTLTHNLGYVPPVSYMIVGSSDTEFWGNKVTINTTQLINNSGQTIVYNIIARDIRTSSAGVNINTTPAASSPTNQDYGWKVSKSAQDVKSAGLLNLVSFSGFSAAGIPVRNLLIHQTGYQDNLANGSTTNFSHNLGYVPLIMAFMRKNGTTDYQLSYLTYQVNPDFTVTIAYQVLVSSSQLSVTNNLGYAIDFAYIIFKDPF